MYFWRDSQRWLGPAPVIEKTMYNVTVLHNNRHKASSLKRILRIIPPTNKFATIIEDCDDQTFAPDIPDEMPVNSDNEPQQALENDAHTSEFPEDMVQSGQNVPETVHENPNQEENEPDSPDEDFQDAVGQQDDDYVPTESSNSSSNPTPNQGVLTRSMTHAANQGGTDGNTSSMTTFAFTMLSKSVLMRQPWPISRNVVYGKKKR